MTLSQLIAKLEDAQKVHGDVKVEITFGDYYGIPSRVASYNVHDEKYTVIDVEPVSLTQEQIDDIIYDAKIEQDELYDFISLPSVEEDVIPQEIITEEKAYEASIDAQYEQYLREDAVDANGYVRTDTPWI